MALVSYALHNQIFHRAMLKDLKWCDCKEEARCTSCRGLILLGAVERRGAFEVGRRDAIVPLYIICCSADMFQS